MVSKSAEETQESSNIQIFYFKKLKIAVTRYDIEKFDGKENFTLWKAKIKAIVGQQKSLKALMDPEKLPKTLLKKTNKL